MAIGLDKVRIALTMPKELKQQLEEVAKEQNRTTSNLIVTILKEYIKKET